MASLIIHTSGSPSTDNGTDEYENMLRYSTLSTHGADDSRRPALHPDDLSTQPPAFATRPSWPSRDPASEPSHFSPEQAKRPHAAWPNPSAVPARSAPSAREANTTDSRHEAVPGRKDDNYTPPAQLFSPRFQPQGSLGPSASFARPPSDTESVLRPLSPVLSTGPDTEAERLENTMDALCLTMKRELLAEFARAKASLAARYAAKMDALRQRHMQETWDLKHQLDDLRERVRVCDATIDSKDRLIESLTAAAAAERGKRMQQQQLMHWRVAAIDRKREEFTSRLAAQHQKRALLRNAFHTWRLSIVNNWRRRVEQACQARARETCEALTRDHEANTQELHETIRQQDAQIAALQTQRAGFEDQMKRALMRGVCALNMEAMGMFAADGPEAVALDARDAFARLSVSAPASAHPAHASLSQVAPQAAQAGHVPGAPSRGALQAASSRARAETAAPAAAYLSTPLPRAVVPQPARAPPPPGHAFSSRPASAAQWPRQREPPSHAVVVERHVPAPTRAGL